ncbi:2-dehydropantoate 2-reductase family [Hypoxylon crocopeplum]|nr:2-dehydropantoate 2-reductase family [Hypoxylon crocopeplum]
MATSKAKVLLVGSGGVGTMGAYAMEAGGLCEVTAVLRSNFATVSQKGFDISSINHGEIKGWKPSKLTNKVPNVVQEELPPFDYIVVTTKNVSDVPPSVVDIITPAVTESHTVIVLVQNGLNIEAPVVAAFPKNIVLSGISRIGAAETSHGTILHNDPDRLNVGPFANPNLPEAEQSAAAERFSKLYSASGKVEVAVDKDAATVQYMRWRKLLYNACYNSVCAITDLDTSRLRIAGSPIDDLVRPAMLEILGAAAAAGHELSPDLVPMIIEADPIGIFFKPSMQQDVEKGNLTEYESILGEPIKVAEQFGVAVPTLKVLYGLMRAIQWRAKEKKGLVNLER